jgi:hypothetical protein
MRNALILEQIAKFMFILSIVVTLAGGGYLFGVFSYRDQEELFQIPWFRTIATDLQELLFPSAKKFLTTTTLYTNPSIETLQPDLLAPGLLLIVGSSEGTCDTYVKVIDRKGTIIHEWNLRWNEVWSEKEGDFPSTHSPRGPAGRYLHGFDILPDGGFVANFEHLSTFRMDICGNVKWKLDNLGHHSVFYSEQGYLWVTAERYIEEGETGYQNHEAPLRSYTLQKLSLDGEILKEIEILDILRKNDLYGLMFLSNIKNVQTKVHGDTLHLNDVDEFPVGMKSNIFEPGDLMVSLRNISALFVFDPESLKIKFLSIGRTLRQHDPDFLPGDRISVFDNRNLIPSTGPEPLSSRILEIDAINGSTKVALQGHGNSLFFTGIMGLHERLANGNILVTSSGEGRVMEFAPDGTIVWRYDNRLSDGRNGRIYTAMLLPEYMNATFFDQGQSSCEH